MQVLRFPTIESVGLPLEGDNMATTKERLDGIDGRLDGIDRHLDRLDQSLGIKPPKPKSVIRQLLETVGHEFRKHWKVAVPTIAICLAVIGWFVNPLYKQHLDQEKEAWNQRVDGRVRAVLNEPNGVNQTLHEIQQTVNAVKTKLETLEPFIQDLIRHQFDSAASLPPKTIGQRLPAVQHLLAVAKDQQIKADVTVLNTLGQKLSTVDTNAKDFWPTAAQFVSYRSQATVQNIQSLLRPDIPNCAEQVPSPMGYRMTPEEEKNSAGPNPSQFIPAVYENCRFVLDSPQQVAAIPLMRDGRSFVIKFKNCQIVYNGGRIAAFTPEPKWAAINGKGPTRGDVYMIKGQALSFENCLFLFSVKTTPPKDGQSMTRELLAQSGPVFSYGQIRIG